MGHEFGAARYPDSICIDGYLWDADSGSRPGEVDSGGEIPCPKCNHKAWREYLRDEIVDDAYVACYDGKSFEVPKSRDPQDQRWVESLWREGYRLAEEDAKKAVAAD